MPLRSERAQGRACVEHGLAMKILEMALKNLYTDYKTRCVFVKLAKREK